MIEIKITDKYIIDITTKNDDYIIPRTPDQLLYEAFNECLTQQRKNPLRQLEIVDFSFGSSAVSIKLKEV